VPSLAAKLGVTPRSRSLLAGPAPADVVAALFEAHRRASPTGPTYDVIVAFCRDREALDRHCIRLPSRLAPAGGLWLAWPKQSSGMAADIRESDVREAGLATGLVDNKIAAFDETWSGLRFVRRRADR
jgi:hypothetical protein